MKKNNGLKAITIVVAKRDYLVPEGGLCLRDDETRKWVEKLMLLYWGEYDQGKQCICDHCDAKRCEFGGKDHFTNNIKIKVRGSVLT